MLFSWFLTLFQVFIFAGWGSLILRRLHLDSVPLVIRMGTGLLFSSAVGNFFHLFFPLQPYVGTFWALVGVSAGLHYFKDFKRADLWVIPVGAVVVGVTLFSIPNYDTGLYYTQTLRWIQQTPAPIGLGYLHARLAFASSWSTLTALASLPGIDLQGGFALEPAWLTVTIVFLFQEVALLAVLAGIWMLTLGQMLPFSNLATPGPDLPASIFTFLALYFAVDQSRQEKTARWGVFLFSVLAFISKLSQAPVVLLFFILAYLKEMPTRRMILLLSLTVSAHWARGILNSGCLAFPADLSCLPFIPWVSVGGADYSREIKAYARDPSASIQEALQGWHWFQAWSQQVLFRPALGSVVVATGLGVVACLWNKKIKGTSFRPRAVFLVSLIGTVFWFLSAPALRFGYGFLMFLGFFPLSLGLERMQSLIKNRGIREVALALCLVFFLVRGLMQPYGHSLRDWTHVRLARLPGVEVREEKTHHGQRLVVPTASDQCWDAPRPCWSTIPKDLEYEISVSGRYWFRRGF